MKERASAEEVQRVRELECEQGGHDYTAIMVFQSSDPQAFFCSRCGKTWRVCAAEEDRA